MVGGGEEDLHTREAEVAGATASTAGAAAGVCVWGGGGGVSGQEPPSKAVRCRSSSVRCRLTVCGIVHTSC